MNLILVKQMFVLACLNQHNQYHKTQCIHKFWFFMNLKISMVFHNSISILKSKGDNIIEAKQQCIKTRIVFEE